jgi:ketosteroid isomerase-like protein
MSQENVEIVRAFATFDRTGDFAWSLIAPDADLVNAPGSPFTNASGLQGFRDWLKDVNEAFEQWEARVDDVLDAPGDNVVVLNHMWGRDRGTGLELEMELNLVYTVIEEKITCIEGYPSRDEALEAAGLRGVGRSL